MRMSDAFFITRKELPNEESSLSTKLLIKSGMIYKNDNGIFSYLPMGLKVLKNVEKIVREEFNKNKAQELLMPSLVPSEIFKSENRNNIFDKELFNFKGRNNKEYSLCPTHEELFAMVVRNRINSYRDLHFTLFQISSKFRDEINTKYGLVRKKEFYMADAYSYDTDESGLDISYDKMYQTFNNIFKRLNIDTLVARSDPSLMNGTESEEFQVVCEYGDNEIVRCTNCSYCTNIEYAYSYDKYKREDIDIKTKKLVKEEEINLKDKSNFIKSIVVKLDESYKMLLLKGNAEINLYKLYKVLKTDKIEFPNEYELDKIGTNINYVGPISATMEIIADNEVKSMFNAICGSNKKGYYYINVNPGVDYKVNRYVDIKLFDKNSLCPRCKSKAEIFNCVEVGQIYKLDTNYSKTYDLKYSDETNTLQYVYMGSYGIGLDRCIDAIVEKHHDENGIIWPIDVSPYKVAIVVLNVDDSESFKYAKKLYEKLQDLKIDTLLDDRRDNIGVKFNDIDLIGIPIRITIGSKLESGFVELKLRNNEKSTDIETTTVITRILDEIDNYMV